MTRGEGVLVPFPFDDLSAAKVRPAVYLTEPIGPHRHVILAFITSRIPTDLLESDVVLDSGQTDFSIRGLRVTSTPRLHRLMTVTTALIRRELGELSPWKP
jgi:mRNA interferase MazF